MNEETALKWYKQASHDLDMAEGNIEIGGYDVAAFLSQQSVEKLLKAIFVFEGRKIPHSHYIDELGQELQIPQDVMDDVLELTADYMFARYPDVADQVPYEAYNQQIAREKVNRARSIFELLKKRLQGSEIQEIEEKKDEREEHETNE